MCGLGDRTPPFFLAIELEGFYSVGKSYFFFLRLDLASHTPNRKGWGFLLSVNLSVLKTGSVEDFGFAPSSDPVPTIITKDHTAGAVGSGCYVLSHAQGAVAVDRGFAGKNLLSSHGVLSFSCVCIYYKTNKSKVQVFYKSFF